MSAWVIAKTPELCAGDEQAFVEHRPSPDRYLSYSSLMDVSDCAAIDDAGYREARSWYRTPEGDPTASDGASLGQAFELVATVLLLKYRRASLVLKRLLAQDPAAAFEFRGVGEEWWFAARAIGAPTTSLGRHGAWDGAPGLRLARPSRLERVLAAVAGGGAARSHGTVLMLGTPEWSRPYLRALLPRRKVAFVNPGTRVLLDVLRSRRRAGSTWLATEATAIDKLEPPQLHPHSDDEWFYLRRKLKSMSPLLEEWVRLGRKSGVGVDVVVSTQDVTPPARAFLLGLKGAGGRILTLEHGISGAYAGQVHSVADVLGAWGRPQAEYHRQFGPAGLKVEPLGWPRLEVAYSERDAGAPSVWDLLFFSQPSAGLSSGDWPEDNIRALAIVDSFAGAHPERRVAVKLHPASAAYGWHNPVVAHAKLVQGDSLSLIRQSRVVAASFSTTGIEAMALGRPHVQIGRQGYLGPVEFISGSGAALSAGDGAEFEVAVESLLRDPAAYSRHRDAGLSYAREFVLDLDRPGSAVARLVALVEDMRHG